MKNQQYQYLCLVEELRKRLQDGELQSGSAIPSEAELAKALSLSKREVRPLLKIWRLQGFCPAAGMVHIRWRKKCRTVCVN